MVFPSVPIYLDPLNWPQHETDGRDSSLNNGHQLLSPPPLSSGGGEAHTGSIKPDYTADRARVAKISHPEAAMKCPRCESTNTKFCYFNNYSLTQPRHFCKTCRRYWTRGGALRNVPVGGGCRRNKRTGKGSRSRSPAAAAGDNNGGNNNYSSTSTSSAAPPAGARGDVMMTTRFPHQHLPDFLTHLSQSRYGGSGDVAGLSFGGVPVGGVRGNGNSNLNNDDVEFQMNIGGGFGHHQYSYLNGVEMAPAPAPAAGNIYAFGPETAGPPESYSSQQARSKALDTAMAAVKEESNNSAHHGLNLSRNFLGISGDGDSGGGNQYWGGDAAANAWTELAGFNNPSSSTRHIVQ